MSSIRLHRSIYLYNFGDGGAVLFEPNHEGLGITG
jgi:hypothetical protein